MPEALLKVHINPRGAKNEITGWRGDVLYIKVTAPPVEGAANAAVLDFLADVLGIRKSQVALVKGEKSREKMFRITGLTEDEIRTRLRK
jgi:uncharacterized protein (TIGR00251 family)